MFLSRHKLSCKYVGPLLLYFTDTDGGNLRSFFFFRRAWSQVKAKKTKATIEILVFTPDVYRGHDNHDKFVRIRTD